MTLYYFAAEVMQGDIDNIIKPILDALSQHIYLDDQQVERLVIQRFEPDQEIRFGLPTVMLEQASQGVRPTLYVRISDDPYEDLKS